MASRIITITEAKDLAKQGYTIKIVNGIAYTNAPIGVSSTKEIDILDALKKARDAIVILKVQAADHDAKLATAQTKFQQHDSRITALENA